MIDIAQARSFLFVPGTRPERLPKAAASGADVIIADLEDAVAPEDKPSAREQVVAALPGSNAMVRINAAGTPWYADDLAAVEGADGLLGVMLPKAEDPARVAEVATRLAGIPLVLLVESALGIEQIGSLTRVEGVSRIAFGTIDYALDLGVTVRTEDEDELLYARSRLAIACRAAGLPGPIDGVTPAIDDDERLARRTTRGLDLGFTAALCIHPRQVPVIHDAYAPSEEQLAWARRVVDAAGRSGGGAVRVDGQMVDRPVLAQAEAILARAVHPTA